jgi:hypothetical protein
MVQHMIFPFYLGTPIPRTSEGKKWKIRSASDTAEVEDETPQDTESKTPVSVRRSVRERRTGFGFSCGMSCSLLNPTGKSKFL